MLPLSGLRAGPAAERDCLASPQGREQELGHRGRGQVQSHGDPGPNQRATRCARLVCNDRSGANGVWASIGSVCAGTVPGSLHVCVKRDVALRDAIVRCLGI